jgi:tetratricopeptide (TPR) repeat protein
LLKARHFHWKVTADTVLQARAFYEEAIALDPRFALAHAEYAEYLYGATTMGLWSLRKVASTMRILAQRALELEPTLADAHVPLGLLAAAHDYDWGEAARQFALAAPGGRGSPLTHMSIGWVYFLGSGRREEAVEQLQLAVQGDPLHLTARATLAMALDATGRKAEAEELLLKSWDLDPDFLLTNSFLADHYASRKTFAEGLPFAERAFTLVPSFTQCVGTYAGLLARVGQTERAGMVLQSLGSGENYGTAKGFAFFHTISGDLDQAAEWYAKAIEKRDSVIAIFLQSSMGESLRASRHWPRLAALMNLPEAASCNPTSV